MTTTKHTTVGTQINWAWSPELDAVMPITLEIIYEEKG